MASLSPAFRKRLASIGPVAQAAARPVMEQGAKELVALMQQLCPVDDGVLRASIRWAWVRAPAGAKVIDEMSIKGLRIVIFAGDSEAFYARFAEFGTSDTPAHPFFWPAYRALKTKIKGRITRAVRKAIKEQL